MRKVIYFVGPDWNQILDLWTRSHIELRCSWVFPLKGRPVGFSRPLLPKADWLSPSTSEPAKSVLKPMSHRGTSHILHYLGFDMPNSICICICIYICIMSCDATIKDSDFTKSEDKPEPSKQSSLATWCWTPAPQPCLNVLDSVLGPDTKGKKYSRSHKSDQQSFQNLNRWTGSVWPIDSRLHTQHQTR